MTTNTKLDYYLRLPYKYSLYPAEEGGYVVEIPDLPGCISQGETVQEAVSMIDDAKRGWLELALEQGMDIPEPTTVVNADYSGKFNVRVPKSLHRALVEKAKAENVSLNQLIVHHLSKSIENKGI